MRELPLFDSKSGTDISTPMKIDQPVKKYDFWSKIGKNGNLSLRTTLKLLDRFSQTECLCRAETLNCVNHYVTDLSYKAFKSYSRFTDTVSMASKNGVKRLKKPL